jgi:hypothetical protein
MSHACPMKRKPCRSHSQSECFREENIFPLPESEQLFLNRPTNMKKIFLIILMEKFHSKFNGKLLMDEGM